MSANHSTSDLGYLKKFVDQYNSTYHRSIGKKPIELITLLGLKKLNRVIKLLKLKLVIESALLSAKVTSEFRQKKYLLLNLC